MLYRLLAVFLLLSSCGKPPRNDLDPDAAILRSRVDALENRLTRLEHRQPQEYAFLKPGQENWVWLWNGAYSLRIGLREVKPSGNGSRVELSVQNPLAVALRDCKASILWGQVDDAGSPVEDTKHEKLFDLEAPLIAGAFSWPSFTLSDIPPSKLGFVTVKSIDCARTG